MSGQTGSVSPNDLEVLLASVRITRRAGAFTFVAADEAPAGVAIEATVKEREGTTYVISCDDAAALGYEVTFRAAWLTLDVESALESVGLTAAVSGALADAGIACNVLAALHHDHLLVPVDDAARAIAVLEDLATRQEKGHVGRVGRGPRPCPGAGIRREAGHHYAWIGR